MSIVTNQEQPKNIERLAAQKHIYSKAKQVIGLQMFLSVPVAISAAVTTILKPEWSEYIAVWGLLVVLVDLFFLQPLVKQLQDNAARIQELFDTSVFGLSWNEISVGRKPDPELVAEKANKHGLSEEQISKFRAWYPIAVNQISEPLGVLICQRSNIWWDSRMRRKYVFAIKAALIFIGLALVGYGIYEKKHLLEFLVISVLPLLSTYVFGYRQMSDHSHAANRLDDLKNLSEKLWSDALQGKNTTEIRVESRMLQDQIFEHRRSNPPIFDFLFKWFRDGNELLMNRGAQDMIDESKQQTGG
ncbi:S-4TM family putative pore-forming effector [Vibrio splendidus]